MALMFCPPARLQQSMIHIFSKRPQLGCTCTGTGSQMLSPSAQTTNSTGNNRRCSSRSVPCLPSALKAIRLCWCLCASLTDAMSVQMWVVWGWRLNRARLLCNQCVWLGGDGGSAGTQTFTIGQTVLVNRSGCTKEAGWIIDRMEGDLALGDFGALILAEREWARVWRFS